MYWQHNEVIVRLHLLVGWASIAMGILSGALMGMFFHKENWLGGYGSVARRLVRLGHIAFFGMAFLNFSLALTLYLVKTITAYGALGSAGLLVATISMPLICLVSAKRGINRAVFSIPVAGTVVMLWGVFGILLHS